MTQECSRRPLRGDAAGVSLSRRCPQHSAGRDGRHATLARPAATRPIVTPERLAELMAMLEAGMARRALEARP